MEKFVSSSELEVGQQVFAIGSPRGLEHTLTRGIISALRETKTKTSRLIQTDAAISPGSSGGGLFDQEARLIGITTFGAEGLSRLELRDPGGVDRGALHAQPRSLGGKGRRRSGLRTAGAGGAAR